MQGMNNKISQAKYQILSICKRFQILKNIFVADFQNFGFVYDKGEIRSHVNIHQR